MENIHTYHVFRVLDKDESDGWSYISGSPSKFNFGTLTDSIENSRKFVETDITKIIEVYQKLLMRYSETEIEFVKLEISIKIESINLGKDEFLEEQKRTAMAKLNEHDVKVLGLQRIATYFKLKYHQSKDDDFGV